MAETIETVADVVFHARLGLVEAVLYSICKKAKSSESLNDESKSERLAATKVEINQQIRGFAKAAIFPGVHLHACLWKNAGNILKNKRVE